MIEKGKISVSLKYLMIEAKVLGLFTSHNWGSNTRKSFKHKYAFFTYPYKGEIIEGNFEKRGRR